MRIPPPGSWKSVSPGACSMSPILPRVASCDASDPQETFQAVSTSGVRVAVAAIARQTGAVRVWIPATTTYSWPTWETPVSHERLKPAYAALRDVWAQW